MDAAATGFVVIFVVTSHGNNISYPFYSVNIYKLFSEGHAQMPAMGLNSCHARPSGSLCNSL